MQNNFLWAIDNVGKAYTLSTANKHWELRNCSFNNRLLEFKRLTATRNCAWALTSDQNLYVYVFLSEVPIRCLEYTYENQRWSPLHGFSERGLFRTDRPAWSDEKGSKKRPRPTDFKLPNEHWEWESEWHVDVNLKGQPTGGGWQYAVTFNPHDRYWPEKRWNSCVRRRKWIRHRLYRARNLWARVPGVFAQPLDSPLMDVAIGGHEIPGQSDGYNSLWVVTAHGKVFCRVGLSWKNPEGSGWVQVSLPKDFFVYQVSVSPSGIAWCVTHDGRALVRSGVSRDHPLGTSWQIVASQAGCLLKHIAVGANALWALSKDNKVWFRKDYDPMRALVNDGALTGSSWIEMIGQMAHIAVGPNDQVWSIGAEDHRIYLRGAVTYEELSGRTWKAVEVEERRHAGRSIDDGRSISLSNLSVSSVFSPRSKISCFSTELENSPSFDSRYYTKSLSDEPDSSVFVDEIIFKNNGNDYRSVAIQTEEIWDMKDSFKCPDVPSVRQNPAQARLSKKARKEVISLRKSFSCEVLDMESPHDILINKQISLDKLFLDDTKLLDCMDRRSYLQNDRIGSWRVKSRETLQREASWTSLYSDKSINFIEDSESDDAEEISCHKSTQTEMNCYGNSGSTISLEHSIMTEGATTYLTVPATNDISRTKVQHECEPDGIYKKLVESSDTLLADSDSNERRGISFSFSALLPASQSHLNSRESRSYSDSLPVMNKDKINPSISKDSLSSNLSKGSNQILNYAIDDSSMGEDLLWVWLSGGSCWVRPSSLPKWFNHAQLSNASFKHKLQEGEWRGEILSLLQERRKQEVEDFQHYPAAVERSSWVKVGRMQWYSEGRRRHWTDCTLELVKELDGPQKHKSKLSVMYQLYGKPKTIDVMLVDITCVLEVNNPDRPALGIYTHKRVLQRKPIKLRVNGDAELRDWLVSLSIACNEVRGIPAAPSSNSVWCTTSRGDIFFHIPHSKYENFPSSYMYWQQIGGHLVIIESCPAGVTWGLSMDHRAWVYSGGYGGGIFKGICSSTTGINNQTDSKSIYLWENQRWTPLHGYHGERSHTWTNESGKQEVSQDAVNPPSSHWHWVSDWTIDYSVSGSTDVEGWQYAREFKSDARKSGVLIGLAMFPVPMKDPKQRIKHQCKKRGFHKEKRWNDYVRRRRWVRKCRLVTTGPWKKSSSLDLLDISLQLDVTEDWDDAIALWAIGTNGDVITRCGVTRENPEGTSWIHVPTDQPFTSISIGGSFRVWAVAKDGSAFFRNGVTKENMIGDSWFHIAAPSIAPLRQISAGTTAVWAVDSKQNLWFRQNITKTFPEGTRWILVSPRVRKVSVGPQDHVWILADYVDGGRGVICRRDGISSSQPSGTVWDKGAGGGIMHVSARGYIRQKQEKRITEPDIAYTHTVNSSYLDKKMMASSLTVTEKENLIC